MKKTIFGLLVLSLSLFATDKKNLYTLEFRNLDIKDNDKVLVDCRYKKEKSFLIFDEKIFNAVDKEHSIGKYMNEFYNNICEDMPNEKVIITINDVKKGFKGIYSIFPTLEKEVSSPDSFYFVWDKKIINDSMITKEFKPFKMYILFTKGLFNYKVYLPIVEFSNERQVSFSLTKSKPSENYKSFKRKILDYKINLEKETINKIKFDKPIDFKEETYTNTYNIDKMQECINGKIWIKKYGKQTNDKCEWIMISR